VCYVHGGGAPHVRKAANARLEATRERILEEMCHISFVDIRDAFDKDGNLLPIKDLPDRVARAIAGIEFDDIWAGTGDAKIRIGRTAKIKLWDKMSGANSIARHLGMFVDKTELSGNLKTPLTITVVREDVP
jgi:phage terminase small subunit